MEPTCSKEKCFLWKTEGEKCPFYVQTIWTKENSPTTKVLEDCAPQRNTILLMDYSARAIGIQKDYEDQRNKYQEVLIKISDLFQEMQIRNKMLQEKLEIPYEKENMGVLDDPTSS